MKSLERQERVEEMAKDDDHDSGDGTTDKQQPSTQAGRKVATRQADIHGACEGPSEAQLARIKSTSNSNCFVV